MRDMVQARLAEAAAARSRGDPAAALRAYQAVLQIDTTHPLARNALGMAALGTGRAAEAKEHFQTAATRDPRAAPLWMNLATACRSLGDDAGEEAALQQVLNLDQRHFMALVRLAELHERRGERVKAAERWSGVIALSSAIDGLPPELEERVAHAREFMRAETDSLMAATQVSLADHLSRATVRDRRRISAAMEVMLGRRGVYANQCSGMHYPFLPADEYFDREHFPWLEQLEAATPMIREEVAALLGRDDAGLSPYVSMAPGTPANKWTPLDNRTDWSALHLWKEGKRVDEACAKAPRTAAFVEQLPLCEIPGRAPTVFFSILKAGSHIPAHTGVTNVRAIVHLPLIVPDGCEFRVGGETRAWREGVAFAFDDTIDHEAWNRSDQDRAVLILDTWNPHLSEDERAMIVRLFSAADDFRHGKDHSWAD